MATATGKSPIIRRFEIVQAAVAQASDTDVPVLIAPFDGTVTLVEYVPITGITGAASNNRTHTLYNRGDDGAGNTKIAELNYAAGVNSVAKVPKEITLSATAANRDVAKGDVLTFTSLHVGTGIADAGGLLVVEISRA